MAMDNATERVNTALAALRTELSEMRNQDVQLMKQLMNINSSIQQLTKTQKHSKRSKSSTRNQRTNFKEMIRSTTLNTISEGNLNLIFNI
jgi:predicted  nucleic acid-binding Zn-ribbon protein